jgi:signal transduction histidine kinase
VLLLVIRRLHATPLQRRTLTPVLLAAIARTAAVAAFLIFGSPVWETGLLILTAWCIPIAIMVGALLADSYRARALEEMVRALRARPTPAELRDMLARAVQDPSLDLAFGQAEDSGVRGVESRRATTPVTSRSGAGPVALVHDAGLLEDEQLLKSLALTTAFALERTELEAAVATARDDTASAVARERRRFERDLHDSAQQRLIAMQIKVSVARLLFERDPGAVRDVLDELQSDAAATLQEVRSVARGIAPALLTDNGLRDALTAATAEAPLSVRVDAPSARYPAVIETAIYFSCVEAVQNAAKHAGAGADVEVRIAVEGSALVFTITDDGTGFDPVATPNVGGLLNIKHRIAELGGTVSLNTKPGAGTSIRGTVPLRTPVDPRSVDYHHDDSTRDAETTANQSLRTSR